MGWATREDKGNGSMKKCFLLTTAYQLSHVQVMNGPQGRNYVVYAGVAAVLLFFLYLWMR